MKTAVSFPLLRHNIGHLYIVIGSFLLLFALGCASQRPLQKAAPRSSIKASNADISFAELEERVRHNPQDGKLWFLLGKAYYVKRDFEKAARSFSRAISLNISHEQRKEAYDKEAWSYYKMGKYDSAIRIFEVAAGLYPNWMAPIAGKACALRQKGHYHEALKYFEKVLTRNPNHLMALDNRGWAYYQMKDYQSALSDFQRAEALAGKRPFWLSNVLSGQGWCYYMLGDFKRALGKFNGALGVAPAEYRYGIWDATRGMAFTKAALGEFKISYELIQKASHALEYDPSRDLALLHYVAGDKKAAWKYMGGPGYIGIGVSIATINGRDHILVTDVEQGGPAQRAGLLPEDIIIQIGDHKIEEFTSFHKSIRSAKPGSNLSVVVWRDGDERSLTIIVGRADPLLRNDPLLKPIIKYGLISP